MAGIKVSKNRRTGRYTAFGPAKHPKFKNQVTILANEKTASAARKKALLKWKG